MVVSARLLTTDLACSTRTRAMANGTGSEHCYGIRLQRESVVVKILAETTIAVSKKPRKSEH